MANLNALGLSNEKVGGVDFADMPEQMGGQFPDPPQPGTYRFRLPTAMDAIWDAVDAQVGKRITAIFDQDHPLTIVQSPGGALDGDPFTQRISNVERKRGKGDDAPMASDMDYLLRDGLGSEKKPKTNLEYAKALQAYAGKEFTADVEFSWNCRDDKDIRVDDGTGSAKVVEGQKGCATRYYQKDVEKVPLDPNNPEGKKGYPVRITCQCGAQLRAFPSLTRFRK